MAQKGGSGVRRALFHRGQKEQGGRTGGLGNGGGLHNSWHNLVQVGEVGEMQGRLILFNFFKLSKVVKSISPNLF